MIAIPIPRNVTGSIRHSWDRDHLRDFLLSRRIIDPEKGCWVWAGTCQRRDKNHKSGSNYGHIMIEGRQLRVHRVALWAFKGHERARRKEPTKRGRPLVRHTCDNPPCFNPDHLEWSTPKENTRDMLAKGRHVSGWAAIFRKRRIR